MRLLFLGDIALHNYQTGEKLTPPLVHNLESVILFTLEVPCGRCAAPLTRSGIRLIAPPDSIQALAGWKGHIACLANNHILDAGLEGLILTSKALDFNGISYLGASRNIMQREMISIESPNGRIGIFNWVTLETTPDVGVPFGAALWPGNEKAAALIREEKLMHDWIIVTLHWGKELLPFPTPEDRQRAVDLAMAGADFIIGGHPHVVRGGEKIDNCQVFYSLGNYHFPDVRDFTGNFLVKQVPLTRHSLGVEINLQKSGNHSVVLRSFVFFNNVTSNDRLRHAEKAFLRLSHPLKTPLVEYERWYRRVERQWLTWGRWWHVRRHELSWREWPLAIGRVFLRVFRSQKS